VGVNKKRRKSKMIFPYEKKKEMEINQQKNFKPKMTGRKLGDGVNW
jgi:hypothetical protein